MFDTAMKTIPYYVLLLLFLTNCQEQPTDIESSKAYISSVYNSVSNTNNDSTYIALKEVEALLSTQNILPDSLRMLNDYKLGAYFSSQGRLDSASHYYFSAISRIETKINAQDSLRGQMYYDAWESFSRQARFGDCIAVADMFSEVIGPNDNYNQYLLNYYYTSSYYRSRNYQKAHEYNQIQKAFIKKIDDPLIMATAKIVDAQLAYKYFREGDRSFAILDSLLAQGSVLNHNVRRQVYGTYGVYKYFDGDYIAAKDNYILCVNETKQMPENVEKIALLGSNYGNLAEVCIDLNQYGDANAYLDTIFGLELSKLNNNTKRNYLKYKFRIASETQKSAREIANLVDTLSIFLERDYQDKYSSELVALTSANEKEKELLAQQQLDQINNLKLQTRFFLALGFIVLLTGLGLLFYRQRKLRFERAGLQMQQRLLRSQMNPHFTFNTLYAIQRQIKEAPEKAHDYLLKFSRLLRLILENSMQNYVLLEDELESLRKYLDLQLLRFPEKFTYTIELNNLQEDDPVFIPPMLIQPFVENAIEHGFSSIDYPGELKIILSMDNKFVSCDVIDNGLGKKNTSNVTKKSASTQLISDFLSKTTGEPVSINHVNHQRGKSGTQVSFLIPYNNNTHG